MTSKKMKCNDEDKNEKLKKTTEYEECVNKLVISPVIRVEINISGMRTGTLVG